jgi:cyclase
MPSARLVAGLHVRDGRAVPDVDAESPEESDPVALAVRYEAAGIDEVLLLDAGGASGTAGALDVATRAATELLVPLVLATDVGGVDAARAVLRAGADRVCVAGPAVERPELVDELVDAFGSPAVLVRIDAARVDTYWQVRTGTATDHEDLDAVDWAMDCARRGAGELLIVGADRDGTRDGYDLALLRAVRESVTVPILAGGGAGSAEHVVAAFDAGADAVLLEGALHDGTIELAALKEAMGDAGLRVRDDGASPDR